MTVKKRIVIALGGNALGTTLPEQMIAVKSTAKAIAALIKEGYQVVITHGNGPQVGIIDQAMDTLTKESIAFLPTPLSVCVAMSQAYIGYDLQNALREELLNQNIPDLSVLTVITQILVDNNDPAFSHPEKPIGPYVTEETAKKMSAVYHYEMKKINEKGYRRVVASPKPEKIIELPSIRTLMENGQIVITCGGGGIPVISQGSHLKGVPAVIDKDLASALLAKELKADCLLILTDVPNVELNYGRKNAVKLTHLTVKEAASYVLSGQFAGGSMLPKIVASIDFAASLPSRYAVIAHLEEALPAVLKKKGTVIETT